MKKKFWIVLSLVILLVSIITISGCDNRPRIAGSFNSQSYGISVSGQGKVTAVPDLAVLSLGVQAQANTVAQAQNQANTSMNAVLNAVKAAGVADKDIQTSQYSVQQLVTYNNNGQQTVIGYQVVNSVTVKVHTVANIGSIIDAAAQAGGDNTRVNSVSFTINDPTPYEMQARDLAVADAKDKATQLAKQAGVRLGRVFYISESGGFNPPTPLPVAVAPSASGSTPISVGTNDVIVNVQISYGIG